ncbi:MAG: ABC transporter ATP-binding protein [Planctomycetota bacterium]
MIEIRNLTKRFGAFEAVKDLSFQVKPGEVLGFLGPNGAGKSTTMKMVTGFLPPSEGTVIVCGHDVLESPRAAKAKIGYLPEGAPLYPDMTPRSMMKFVGAARGMSRGRIAERMQEVTRLVDLGAVLDQKIETLSKGFKRRVGLALAILHDPDVLILDEPTDGLDPNQKHEVRQLIRSMAKGKVIVLSTHILEEVEAVCTRAMIVSAGKKCFDGTPRDLREHSRYAGSIEVSVATADAAAAEEAFTRLASVKSIGDHAEAGDETRFILFPVPGSRQSLLDDVQRISTEAPWTLLSLSVDRGRMDDVFRTVTSGEALTPIPSAAAAPELVTAASGHDSSGDSSNGEAH